MTPNLEDTSNPIFYRTIEVDFDIDPFNNYERAKPIILQVFDTDTGLIDSTDDYLGKAVIFITELGGI